MRFCLFGDSVLIVFLSQSVGIPVPGSLNEEHFDRPQCSSLNRILSGWSYHPCGGVRFEYLWFGQLSSFLFRLAQLWNGLIGSAGGNNRRWDHGGMVDGVVCLTCLTWSLRSACRSAVWLEGSVDGNWDSSSSARQIGACQTHRCSFREATVR